MFLQVKRKANLQQSMNVLGGVYILEPCPCKPQFMGPFPKLDLYETLQLLVLKERPGNLFTCSSERGQLRHDEHVKLKQGPQNGKEHRAWVSSHLAPELLLSPP